uniref:G-patch domain-containing protein n=1 Tax=Ditylenchus dipsaci TaxID=166011 RepID=A0A915DDP5_9BILA
MSEKVKKDKKEKKHHSSTDGKKSKKAEKHKKPTSDEILDSLFESVKNSAEPSELENITQLISAEEKKAKKSSKKHKSSSSKRKKEKKAKKSRSPADKSPYSRKKSPSRKRRKSRSESRETDIAFSKSIARRNSDRDQDTRKKLLSSPWRRQLNHMVTADNGNSASTSDQRRRARSRSFERRRSRSRDRDDQRRRRYSPYNSRDRRRAKRSPLRKKFFIEDYTDKFGRIDKDRLLDIATKNASRLAMEGKLPKGAEYLDTIKNKSIDQLVSLCREIQDDEEMMEKVSSDEEERYNRNYDKWRRNKMDKNDEEFAPQPVRNSSEIKINISNANALPTKTPQQRMHEDSSTLRSSFPVSSGAQHRQKSGVNDWMPVIKPDAEPVGPLTTALSKIKTNIPAAYKPANAPPPSTQWQRLPQPATSTNGSCVSSFDCPGHAAIEAAKAKLEEGEIVEYKSTGMSVGSIGLPPPPPSEPQTWNQLSGQIFDPASIYAAQTTASATYEPVFPKPSAYSREWDQGKSSDLQHLTKGKTEAPLSVTDLVARRLRYSSRLKDDPNDFDAMKKINEIDEQMSEWAMSKNLPGQFIGSTGARVLSAKELAPTNQKFNAWAKKDLFRNAPELSSGVGMKLLQKMGWQCGQGLGREMQGQLEPLMLDVKSDRKGLQSTEDRKVSKRESVVDPSGKNPVSVVMEYCSKNRLGAPTFSCMELGPQNDKRFLWKAVLNGVEYEPSLPPPTRKLENLKCVWSY